MSQRCVREAVFTDRLQRYESQRCVTEVSQKNVADMSQWCVTKEGSQRSHTEASQKCRCVTVLSQMCHNIGISSESSRKSHLLSTTSESDRIPTYSYQTSRATICHYRTQKFRSDSDRNRWGTTKYCTYLMQNMVLRCCVVWISL